MPEYPPEFIDPLVELFSTTISTGVILLHFPALEEVIQDIDAIIHTETEAEKGAWEELSNRATREGKSELKKLADSVTTHRAQIIKLITPEIEDLLSNTDILGKKGINQGNPNDNLKALEGLVPIIYALIQVQFSAEINKILGT